MKRLASTVLFLLALGAVAFGLAITNTPVVAPTETGENSQASQQILDMARFKPGFSTGASTACGGACAITANTAAGTLPLTGVTAGASGATPTTVTVTDSKVQSGDFVLCSLDTTGSTAGSVPTCSAHITAAGTFTIVISNGSVTALAASPITANFLIVTQGNPN